MGYDKEKLSKLLRLVETIYNDKGPDVKEFTAGIDALSMSNVKGSVRLPVYPTEKLDDIYEYCLSRNLRKQAANFYAGFPLADVIDELVNNFISMEECRRRDDFIGYARDLFLQIEAVMNSIARDTRLDELVHRMFPAEMYEGKQIVDYIYGKYRKDYKTKEDMSLWSLDRQQASNKFGIIEFFVCLKYTPGKFFARDKYSSRKELFNKLKAVRDLDSHGGIAGSQTEWQKKTCEEVLSSQSQYYLNFVTLLNDFMSDIRTEYPLTAEQYDAASKK